MTRFSSIIILLATGLAGCEAIRPYEKEFLLHPLMDDAVTARLKSPLMATGAGRHERFAQGGGASAEGKACPTCGG